MDMICTMAMGSWAKLNAVIGAFTEEQLVEMLEHEKVSGQRLDIMVRIQQRLNALSGARKIEELKGMFTK
jgi:hypothetical protein